MRTSMNLPDDLLAEAKARAAAEGRTVTSLVEEGLRTVLDTTSASPEGPFRPLPMYGTPGEQRALIDISDREALWEALDADGLR